MHNRSFRSSRCSALMVAAIVLIGGCAAVDPEPRDDFFTAGSPEADQRAEQRMARHEQLRDDDAADAEGPRTLYERLGGEKGINLIVNDFVARALADPRVNWQRHDVDRPGFFRRGQIQPWQASQQNVARLKKHIAQFFAVATGGPTVYQGRDMREAHEGMRITNSEFDAAVGALKASLDRLGVPADEQKELLSVVETTRPQIVEER
jgi:hemoglobin